MEQTAKAREIKITARDMDRLKTLIEEATRNDPRKKAEFKSLEAELDRATLVPDTQVPADVITMNSEALLVDLDTGEEMICKLVFPGQADITRMQISVLAPVGTAMLGYRAGDTFEWQVPAGMRRLMVKEVVHLPEAALPGSPRRDSEPAQRANGSEDG